jgi:hypothetical protein
LVDFDQLPDAVNMSTHDRLCAFLRDDSLCLLTSCRPR